MEISELYKLFLKHPNITIDSRDVPDNSIFWALKGEKFNGNKFAYSALKAGASYAIIDDKKFYYSEKTIFVQDVLKMLQLLANYHRKQLNLPILALTGTNGKTTTKELILTILSTQYNIKATQGNFNNHIGVPLTILTFNKLTEIGIVEMGANHSGEIKELCNIAEPNFGLITNIGKAHLEGFGSFEGVIKTKAELYQSIIKNKGTIFFNSDNSVLNTLEKGNKTLSYGTNKESYLKAQFLSANPFVNLEIETSKGLKTKINSRLIGFYNFENIAAASCVGDFFKISIRNIKKAIENYIPDNNRSQFIQKNHNKIILDAYNANPTSMSLAIDNFMDIEQKNKVIILGDMFELGKHAEKEHTNIVKKLIKIKQKNKNIRIYIIGSMFHSIYINKFQNEDFESFKTTKEFINYISEKKFKEEWFFIKGSRGMKLETVVQYINTS